MKFKRIIHGQEILESTLSGFLLAIPHLISKKDKLIPPHIVLNELLQSGIVNLGMEGIYEWEAITLLGDEYINLVNSLVENGYKQIDVPEWVVSINDWVIWKCEYLQGIPAIEHKKLVEREKLLSDQYKAAVINGNSQLIDELAEKHMLSKLELADFLNKY